MHLDCAVQTSSSETGLTLVVDDIAGGRAVDARCRESPAGCTDTSCDCGCAPHNVQSHHQHFSANSSPAQRHFAKYEPHQLQEISDEIELGWDCAICLETAEEPCVTRCGHLYCQSHLNHWLATHPSCPVCKTLCTPSQDVVPIFSRGRTSPVPSPSIPASPASSIPLDDVYHDDRFPGYAPLTPQSRSGSPTPTLLHSHWPPDMTGSDCLLSDYDIMPDEPMPSTPPLPRVSPASSAHSAIQPPPHPLMATYLFAHYLGIALRIVGVVILLGVLLR